MVEIKVHSFVDVITNSSTSIYVSCHGKTIEFVKTLIGKLLKVAGVEGEVEDYFSFYIKPDEDRFYDRFSDMANYYFDEPEEYPELKDFFDREIPSNYLDLKYKEKGEISDGIYKRYCDGDLAGEKIIEDLLGDDEYAQDSLAIVPKEGSEIDLRKEFEAIFSMFAERDG